MIAFSAIEARGMNEETTAYARIDILGATEAVCPAWDAERVRLRKGMNVDENGLFDSEREYLERLHIACSEYMEPDDLALVERSVSLALCAHATQMRDSGEPYSTHLFEVTLPLAKEHKLDAITIASALLHDAKEDQDVPLEYIAATIHPEVSETVDALSKFKGEKIQKEMAQEAANVKIITSLLENPRVAIIKLYDKLHNLKTLKAKKRRASRLRTMTETREIYIPLAEIMGMHVVATNLEEELLRQGNGRRLAKFEELHQKRANTLWEEGENELSTLLYEGTHIPFDINIWTSSVAAMIRDNGELHYNVDLVLRDELLSNGKGWGQKALSLYDALGLSEEYDLEVAIDVEKFGEEVRDELTDSLMFWAVSKIDGKRLHVHIYPEEAYRLDTIPLTFLYYSGRDSRDLCRSLGEEKHRSLRHRLLTRLDETNSLSTQMMRELAPRLGASMIRIIGENNDGDRFPSAIAVGSSVIDFVKDFAPTEWAKAIWVTVNGNEERLDYRLNPNDIVHVTFGDHPTWNPRLIHSFRTDMEGKKLAQKQLEKLYRTFRQHEQSKYIELRQQILDEGIRQLENLLPENERPLLIGTGRCQDIIEEYLPTKFITEDILFHIGMGYVDEGLLHRMAERLRNPNQQVGVMTLSFERDQTGLTEAAAQAATAEGLSYTRVAGITRNNTSPSIVFVIDPDDYDKATTLLPLIQNNETCHSLGLASVSLRHRNEPVWFSHQNE